MDGEQASKGFWCRCAACSHCWIAAYYPQELHLFAQIAMKAVCPKCGGTAMVAKQDDGVLKEPQP